MFLSLLNLCASLGICFTMNAERPHFLSQPVVKNIFVYRNGDPYYEARRLVINEKRVSNFETFLREVTGGVKPPFGAVRNIYTPREGHRVASMEHLQSGEQYVAAGREKFKKLDYFQIGARKKRMQQSNGLAKPVPQSRIIVSARFLKPIKEPCAIFVIANGDLLNPALRLLIPHRIVGQYERILEMISEKIGLKIIGGVRSLYTLNGSQITEGKQLEAGQLYIAVGRDKFKKLPYNDLLFMKPTGIRRVFGSKAASLPPISRYRKSNGSVSGQVSMSVVTCSEPSEGKSPVPPQGPRERLSSIVKQISQSQLINLRKKISGLSMSLSAQDNDEGAQAADDGAENTEEKPPEQEEPKPQQTQPEEQPEERPDKDEPDATTEPAAEVQSSTTEPAAEAQSATTEPAAEVQSATTEPAAEVQSSTIEPAAEVQSATTEQAAEVQSSTIEPAAEVKSSTTEPAAEVQSATTEQAAEVQSSTTEPAAEGQGTENANPAEPPANGTADSANGEEEEKKGAEGEDRGEDQAKANSTGKTQEATENGEKENEKEEESNEGGGQEKSGGKAGKGGGEKSQESSEGEGEGEKDGKENEEVEEELVVSPESEVSINTGRESDSEETDGKKEKD